MAIELTATTKSNLYIGGTPQTFEIGGIDMQTVTDKNGKPFIPASSFKGAVREIAKTEPNDAVINLYKSYLISQKDELETQIRNRGGSTQLLAKFDEAVDTASPLYLFGIGGFNHSPKLLFNDLLLIAPEEPNLWFSIDKKNSIEENGNQLKSNPRIYKAASSGLTFQGSIGFWRLNKLGDKAPKIIDDYIKQLLGEFSGGIYRLGNSKSRGYGWIEVVAEGELT